MLRYIFTAVIALSACFVQAGAVGFMVGETRQSQLLQPQQRSDVSQRLLSRAVVYLNGLELKGQCGIENRGMVVLGLLDAGFSTDDSFIKKQVKRLREIEPQNDSERSVMRNVEHKLKLMSVRTANRVPVVSLDNMASLTVSSEIKNYQGNYRKYGTLIRGGIGKQRDDSEPSEMILVCGDVAVVCSPDKFEPVVFAELLPPLFQHSEKYASLDSDSNFDYVSIILTDRCRK